MSNYNKVLLMGRLTRDPELRYTQQGIPVTEIGLAVNREYVVGAERRKETTFVDITLWRRQAEVVCQYLKKGQPIFIEGKLTLDSWETPDGQKRSKLRVVADNFQFLGSRGEVEAPQGEVSEEGGGYGAGSYGGEGYSPGGPGGGSSQGAARRWGGGGRSEGGRPAPGAASGPPSTPPAAPDEESLGIDENDVPF